ncbi:SET-domain-containing protein [Favolaschia claudopus]|uniref:SET-domain-containing protein n=1 Tax=Favolaschia claudopus TaxID=2862362 RepID=A0AAW0DCK0_9AGAR
MSTSINYEVAEHENLSILELTRCIYHDVRTEFRTWKRRHAEQKLASAYSSNLPHTNQPSLPPPCFQSPPSPDLDMDSEPSAIVGMQVLSYDSDGNIIQSTVTPIEVHDIVQSFAPYPDYRYYSPSSRNVNARMLDEKYAPFHPFPEDPSFPVHKYFRFFKGLQWIDDMVGPDEEIIQFEVVRRLHIEHGVSGEDIDRVLKLYGDQENIDYLPLRDSHESGLLWAVSQRDQPDVIWRDGLPSSSKIQIPPHFVQSSPDPKDDFSIINKSVGKFCANLNCIQDNCGVHVSHEWELQTPSFRTKRPRYASKQLKALVDEPCDNECFSLFAEDSMDDDSLDALPTTYRTVLISTLKVEPDMLPCDLAVICEMTCLNVYRLRKQVLGDDMKTMPACLKETTILSQDLGSRPGLCSHSGKCSTATDCPCFVSGTRCERNCRCDDKCLRRFEGCNSTCDGEDRTCHPGSKSKCKCVKANRECDPEKCTKCNARYHIVVKKADYGLGGFAANSLKKGTFIGEYVGELIGDDQAEQRCVELLVIQKHTHLNYCFGTNGGDIIDAQSLGNRTRFLNDSQPKKPNCTAAVILVNGDKRVAITTAKNVNEGDELTLSYGKPYWKAMLSQAKHNKKTTRSEDDQSVESVLGLFTLKSAVAIASQFIVVEGAENTRWNKFLACVGRADEKSRRAIKVAALAGCGTKRKHGADQAKPNKQRRVEGNSI